VGAHEVEEMQEVKGHCELLLCGDVPRPRQCGFLPRERMRMPSSNGAIQSSLSVSKRVTTYIMEVNWSMLTAMVPITSGG
jgi:hypothetical protein